MLTYFSLRGKERWTQIIWNENRTSAISRSVNLTRRKLWGHEQQWKENLSTLTVTLAFLQVVLHKRGFFTIYRQELVSPSARFWGEVWIFYAILFKWQNWDSGRFSIQGHKGLTTESASPGSKACGLLSGHPEPCSYSRMLSGMRSNEINCPVIVNQQTIQNFSFEIVSLTYILLYPLGFGQV